MSDAVFPLLPGLDWNSSKAPKFNTKVLRSVNGRELRASFQSTPTYTIRLSFAFLRERSGHAELRQLEGFFLARRGAFDSFLLALPGDSDLTQEYIGTGDGSRTSWQVQRTQGGVVTPLTNIDPASVQVTMPMWSEAGTPFYGEPTSPMWATPTCSPAGVLTFSRPPEAGQAIYFTGRFYYRCRFVDDEQEYSNFAGGLWEAKKIDLIGSLSGKI